ncbi:hypothetical protein [Pectobacterium carotovorum]|uniref:hypothetical protein n=1 Tax=Pectobacterium carotovorum TaxID=554 RepID=UPI000500405F|nr:hypothetical protein [Pectobacterium carotovorum]KFW99870.1 hypothetical protein JV33_13000 [Pectobacterium carotovorum subsp. carotovorum]KML69529.1 hypothetical protein G032_11365 [Pectobacterium carotovorum subsp. carotovorum ICMP 5702]MBA0176486.1 hypothetical protein [Pectobacterium carotovorum]MBL0906787.1 hypothetical protein [Pectobacterium carotovorum]SHG12224.1 hypothetical protein SAMN05444147_101480 [Pectobacterium carotovorum]
MLTDNDIDDVKKLIILLEQVIIYLKNDGSSESAYSCLKKAVHILENRDVNGMCNINKNIMSDFRMMVDRGQYGGDIDLITDKICSIVKNNPLFNK